jgi:hypothetical protein
MACRTSRRRPAGHCRQSSKASAATFAAAAAASSPEPSSRAAAGQAQEQIGVLGTRVVVDQTGSLFRARVSGLSSRNGAEQACSRLRDRGACFIVAPGA